MQNNTYKKHKNRDNREYSPGRVEEPVIYICKEITNNYRPLLVECRSRIGRHVD